MTLLSILVIPLLASLLAAATPTPFAAKLEPRTRPQLALGNLTTNTAISTAGCSDGEPWDCVQHVMSAVVTTYFSTYRPQNVDGPGVTKRNVDSNEAYDDWTALTMLTNEDGNVHGISHFATGNIRGLRATHQTAASSANLHPRVDTSSYGGFIADYYWISTPPTAPPTPSLAYTAFNPTATLIRSATVLAWNYMVERSAIEVCLDFMDDEGVLNEGVLALGWGGKPFVYRGGVEELRGKLKGCQLGDLLHDNAEARIFDL